MDAPNAGNPDIIPNAGNPHIITSIPYGSYFLVGRPPKLKIAMTSPKYPEYLYLIGRSFHLTGALQELP